MADIISGAKNLLLKAKTGASTYQSYYVKSSIYTVDGLLGDDDKIKSTLMPSWVTGGMKFVEVLTNDTTLDTLYSKIVNWLEDRDLPTSAPYTEFQGKYFIVAPMNPTINLTIPEGQTNLGLLYGDDAYGGNQGESGGPGTPIVLERGDWIMYSHYSGTTHFFAVINNTYKDARENEAGVIPLATEADALAGTNDTKAMTPLKTTQVINNKLANYYVKSDVYTKTEVNNYLANKQPLHPKLTSLSELTNTAGFVKQSSDGTFRIENEVYATPEYVMSEIGDHLTIFAADINASLNTKAPKNNPVFTGTITTPLGAGFVKSSSAGVLSVDTNVVTGIKGNAEETYRTGQVNITKQNIGLNNVNNWGIASQSDVKANAASVSNKYMTPQRTLEAIDYWATISVYASEGEIPSDLPVGKLVFVEV